MTAASEVWITGTGVLCPAGEAAGGLPPSLGVRPVGVPIWPGRQEITLPLPDYDLAAQVPGRSDRRAMGPMMRHAAYAAGLALESAGLKGDDARLGDMHLVVASGSGERNLAHDIQIAARVHPDNEPDKALNLALRETLKPTHFLTQLNNLTAANIAIIYGVSGSSRTLVGESTASIQALRMAMDGLQFGDGALYLVGGAKNGQCPYTMLALAEAGLLRSQPPEDGFWTADPGGIVAASGAAFLVLEKPDHARERGARPLARLVDVSLAMLEEEEGEDSHIMKAAALSACRELPADKVTIISGASGIVLGHPWERAFFDKLREQSPGLVVRTPAHYLGYAGEAAFFVNIALAAGALGNALPLPVFADDMPLETEADEPDCCLVTHRGVINDIGLVQLRSVKGEQGA